MKFIIFLFIIFSSSIIAKVDKTTELISMLTPEELKMHNCILALNKSSKSFQKDTLNCVKGSQYYSSRAPSSANFAINSRLINNQAWFFDSDFLKLDFLKMIKNLVKARNKINKIFKKVSHGNGMGVHGAAYFGVGVNWLAEVMIHNGKIGLFCAPGMSIQPAVGAAIGVVGEHTLSCKDNNTYEGGFLTAAGGINTSYAGLPFSGQLSYSLGIDIKKFIQDLKKSHKNKTIDYNEMAHELRRIDDILASKDYDAAKYSIPIYFGLKASSFINKVLFTSVKIPSDVIKGDLPISAKYLKKQIKGKESLGRVMKGQIDTLVALLKKYDLPNTIKYFHLLDKNITGCDAIGGSASIAPSAGALLPVDLSIAYYNYHLLYEMNEMKLLSFKSLNAFKLLNPYFINTNLLKDIVFAAKKITKIPAEIQKNCYQDNLFR